jgi:hypothetical protein
MLDIGIIDKTRETAQFFAYPEGRQMHSGEEHASRQGAIPNKRTMQHRTSVDDIKAKARHSKILQCYLTFGFGYKNRMLCDLSGVRGPSPPEVTEVVRLECIG